MSNFLRNTKHPDTGEFEMAEWLDDYYGKHNYGVRFKDGTVHKAEFVEALEKDTEVESDHTPEALPNPTTSGEDKGSAAQTYHGVNNDGTLVRPSEPISELEQLAQDWIDKNVDSHLGFINWTNSTRRLKDLFILIHQQSFQDGVNKALEALPEPVRYNETTVPKYLKPAEGENWQQALRHEDGYNTAIFQAKENIGKLK